MADGLSKGNVITPFLNWFNGTSVGTAPTNLQVQLHTTGGPGASGTSNVSVGNSTKQTVTLTTSAAGSAITLTGTNPSWTNGGTSETITDISVWGTGGANFLWSVALSSSQAWVSTNTFTLTTLSVSMTPQAA